MRFYSILLAVLFVSVVQISKAQTFGVKAGLNYSTFRGPTETGSNVNEQFGYSNGFHFGLSYSYNVTDIFSIRTELFYIQNGSRQSYEGDSYYIIRQPNKTTYEDGILEFYDLNISNAYISIPIVANYRINSKWEIFGGAYINMLIGPTGIGQMKFLSDERPEDIRFIQSLDFRYNSDAPSEVSGRSVDELQDIGIRVDGEVVILPQFAGSYTRQGEKTGNMFNFLDYGLTFGGHYFLNKGFFIGVTVDYGIPDLTNNEVDVSLKELNPDNTLIFKDDVDRHFGIKASFGFRF